MTGSGCYSLDASALIHAWDEVYSPDIFPSLYSKLKEIHPKRIIVLKEMMDEADKTDTFQIGDFIGNTSKWIKESKIIEIIRDSGVKEEYGPLAEKYRLNANKGKYRLNTNKGKSRLNANKEKSRGISNNDLLLIIHAKKHGHCVVTEESKQSPYKIPHICKGEGVECMNLVEFFRACQIRI